jgi:RNA polymerase sigma-70 factor (ECF subfamily)
MSVEEAYKKYKELLYWYARRFAWNDPDRVQEIVQRTIVKVLHTGVILEEKKAVSYLLRAMHSVAIDMHRGNFGKISSKSIDLVNADGEEKTETGVYKKTYTIQTDVDTEAICNELYRIDPKWAVLFLKYLQGWKYKEISDMENIPVGTIKAKFHRLRKKAMENKVIKNMRIAVMIFSFGLSLYACNDCPDTCQDRDELDSLKRAAIEEVDEYRQSAFYQVDTMRDNFMSWQEKEVKKLNDLKDSLLGTTIYDNMIIYADSSSDNVQARFDTVTGKPYLEIIKK